MDWFWITFGAALLWVGGEALVRGARDLALRFGVTPLVIGLTVVAFGTSMPELAATLTATLEGAPEVAFGNVVGSNIANLGLVLGAAALLAPLAVEARFLAREMPFMIASTLLAMAFAWNGLLSRPEGAVLLVGQAVFLAVLLFGDRERPEVRAEFVREFGPPPRRGPATQVTWIVLGVAALTLGAKALVDGGVGVARALGIEERVIGLTLVAFGTSLPEVASSLVAALRREGDIVIGNLIGSNVFNVLFILGTTVVVRPIAIDGATAEIDLAVMAGLAALVLPLMWRRRRLGRPEGALLLALYGAYIGWIFVRG